MNEGKDYHWNSGCTIPDVVFSLYECKLNITLASKHFIRYNYRVGYFLWLWMTSDFSSVVTTFKSLSTLEAFGRSNLWPNLLSGEVGRPYFRPSTWLCCQRMLNFITEISSTEAQCMSFCSSTLYIGIPLLPWH